MSYQIVEIEVTKPLPQIILAAEETGIALLIRYRDRAIEFMMQQRQPNTTINPEELAQLIAKEVGAKILQEQIRTELIQIDRELTFPSLTIAICTKDRTDNLARCLNSLLQLPQSDLEILVIDNAPSDWQTKNLVTQLPGIKYICETKPGLDFARNKAITEAKGEILAFIDDDVVVDRNWLKGLQEAWRENPDALAFTGLVLPYELKTPAQIIFERGGGFRRGFEKIRYGKVLVGNPLYPCGAGIFGAGCNMAFRREILLELGGFDEALDTGATLPGGGDLDIFYRVIRAGYPLVYEPQYLVFHQHRQDLTQLRRQYWSWGLGFMAFVVKSYQTDLGKRSQLIRLIKWWFKYQLRQGKQSLKGKNPVPISMVLAELWGGIMGLLGGYQRSLRRIESIKTKSTVNLNIAVKS
jgi:GT2 family glycosyltransferase